MIDPLENMYPILYKYRDINNDSHKRLLFNHEIYFTSASKFNDPFDANLPFKYKEEQLTEENIFLKYYSILKIQNPNWTDPEIHKVAYEAQRKGLMKDELHQEKFNENIIKDIHSNFGIVSLSKIPNNMLMWSHYANCHTGFCVGIDPKFIFKHFGPHISVEDINYQADIPRIDLFEDPIVYFIKVLCTKSLDWEYEKECRLVNRNYVNKALDITERCIKEIYLGAKMPHTDKFSLIDKLAKQYSTVKIFDCSLSKNSFKVDTMQVY